MLVTLLIATAVGIAGWKAGRRYQKWRSGPGWHKQLRD